MMGACAVIDVLMLGGGSRSGWVVEIPAGLSLRSSRFTPLIMYFYTNTYPSKDKTSRQNECGKH